MDYAWHPASEKIVLADDLWGIEHPKEELWECDRCGLTLHPAACDPQRREEYKVRPYFRANEPHICDTEIDEILAKGKKCSVLQEQNLPFPIYDRLKLPDQTVITGDNDNHPIGPANHARIDETTAPAKANTHHREATSIRPICQQYMNFPHDRQTPLDADGVAGSTYWEVFQPIRFKGVFTERRIFIGEIKFSSNLVVDIDRITIPLLEVSLHQQRSLR